MLESERKITSKKISKFKRREGEGEKTFRDVLRSPVLTLRDKDVLLSLYYQRCLTTHQIAEIHYKYDKKGKENSQAELIARRRLRKLFDAQLVDRFFVDIGQGSSQGHIVLDTLGAKVVAGLLNLDYADLHWSYEMNESRLPYLKHMTCTNDFYIYLLQKARELGHEVTGFKAESHVRHSFKFWGKTMVVNPDAYGQYWYSSEGGFHFFLEWDNGTMSIPVFQRKHQRYTAFYASKEYESQYGEFPVVLTVAPTLDHALKLRDAIYAIDNTDMRWLFTSHELAKNDILGKVWYGKQKEPVGLI